VINTLSADVSGTVDCSTGATDIAAPLSSVLFLTGDTSTDPGSTIPGIQPCPLLLGRQLRRRPEQRHGLRGRHVGDQRVVPTSNDCPPDPMFNIGTLPVNFALTSGSLTWSGTTARTTRAARSACRAGVFSGFCRDADGTGRLRGLDAGDRPALLGERHGVGRPAAGPFESCEQRNNGAFGPSGGANRTIVAVGNSTSLLGGPAAGRS
jgi:hypothetical protein